MLDIGRQIGLAKHIGVRLVADLASGAKDADEPLSQHRADGVSDHLRRQQHPLERCYALGGRSRSVHDA